MLKNLPTLEEHRNKARADESAENDETVMVLVKKKEELEKQMQGWTDWANKKVMQAAQRLSQDQAELRKLREERNNNTKTTAEENTVMRFSEMEIAMANIADEKKMHGSFIERLHTEHIELRKETMSTALTTQKQNQSLDEAIQREQDLQKQNQSMVTEMSHLQGDITPLKTESSKKKKKLEKAHTRHSQIEALWKHEEKEKNKILEQADKIRRERMEILKQTKIEEDNLKAIAEKKEKVYKVRAEIMKLKMAAEASKAIGSSSSGMEGNNKCGPKRHRKCAMCLTGEVGVVFLPCAHQVLCKECNGLHVKQGMNDCPSCPTPIVHRIYVHLSHHMVMSIRGNKPM